MDVALGIEALLPKAQYFGSTTANTKECFDNLDWQDKRTKPTWDQIEEAYAALPEKITNPQKFEAEAKANLFNKLGITEDEAKLLLS